MTSTSESPFAIQPLIEGLQKMAGRGSRLHRTHLRLRQAIESSIVSNKWDGAALLRLLDGEKDGSAGTGGSDGSDGINSDDIGLPVSDSKGPTVEDWVYQAPDSRKGNIPGSVFQVGLPTATSSTMNLPAPLLCALVVDEQLYYLSLEGGEIYHPSGDNSGTAVQVGHLDALGNLYLGATLYGTLPAVTVKEAALSGYYQTTDGSATAYEPLHGAVPPSLMYQIGRFDRETYGSGHGTEPALRIMAHC